MSKQQIIDNEGDLNYILLHNAFSSFKIQTYLFHGNRYSQTLTTKSIKTFALLTIIEDSLPSKTNHNHLIPTLSGSTMATSASTFQSTDPSPSQSISSPKS